MDYIGDGASLPVPLNIFGAPSDLLRALLRCCCDTSESDDEEIEQEMTTTNVIQNNHYENGDMVIT